MTAEARAEIMQLVNNQPKLRTEPMILANTHPELAKQWHPTKNGTLNPSDVTANSHKKVWWIGICGHEWDADISNRAQGAGCPICTNRRVLVGYNDLATTHPALSKQWHPTLNGTLKPTDVIAGSSKKVWWRCDMGHEWYTKIEIRARGADCPVCSNRQLLQGYNDLLTRAPEIAEEWHPTRNNGRTPQEYLYGSNQKVWWQCKICGYEWKAQIVFRVTRGDGCQKCAHRHNGEQTHKRRVEQNCLFDIKPNVAQEWHPTKNGPLTPKDVAAYSQQKVWWLGKCGHEWEAIIANRSNGSGCPSCSNQTSINEQSVFYYIQQIFPDAINRAKVAGKEADILIPSLKAVIEYDGWRHNESRIEADIEKARHMQDNGMSFLRIREPSCPVLPTKVGECFWLASTKPDAVENAIRWVLQQLQQLSTRFDMPNVDLCRDMQTIRSQIKKYKFEHSLAYLYPDLCQEWDYELNYPLTPEMVTPCSVHKVFWKCPNGHSYRAALSNRTKQHSGCHYCSNDRVLAGYNDLETLNPALAKHWHPTKNGTLTPADVMAGSHHKRWWICNCGCEFLMAVDRSDGRCPTCRKYFTHSEKDDLATTHPHLLSAWDYELNTLLPTQITEYSHYKAAWKCPNGHIHYKRVDKYIACPRFKGCNGLPTSHTRACMVQHEDGSLQTYTSIKDAAASTGYSTTTIRNYCNGSFLPRNSEKWSWVA